MKGLPETLLMLTNPASFPIRKGGEWTKPNRRGPYSGHLTATIIIDRALQPLGAPRDGKLWVSSRTISFSDLPHFQGHCQGWVLDPVSDRARKWAYGIFPGPRTYQGSEEGSQEPAGKLQSSRVGLAHLAHRMHLFQSTRTNSTEERQQPGLQPGLSC
ncbi:hypothetical protein VULLAG_LOCUS652 [Vulpes lagopus]